MTLSTSNQLRNLELLALTVERLVRERGIDRAPARADYLIASVGRYGEGRPDVQVDFDLGRGLAVRLDDRWLDPFDDEARLTDVAKDLAMTIQAVLASANEIRATVRELRAAAKREVAKATRRGLPWRLIDVQPSAVDASEPFDGPSATIRMEVAGCTPVPAPFALDVCRVADLLSELDAMWQEQDDLARQWRALAAAGAVGAIDAVLHADLMAAGHDVPTLLRRMATAAREDFAVSLDLAGHQPRVIHWTNGVIHGAVELGGGATFHNGQLSYAAAPAWVGGRLRGRPLASFVDHPAIRPGVVIVSAHGGPCGYGRLTCTAPVLLFDATGRTWEADAPALAA